MNEELHIDSWGINFDTEGYTDFWLWEVVLFAFDDWSWLTFEKEKTE